MEIHQSIYRLYRIGVDVRFCWVPAHVGMEGNQENDKIAKQAVELTDVIKMTFGKGEVKAILKKELMNKWQERWDKGSSGRTYYGIQKRINAHGVMRGNRREETVLQIRQICLIIRV